MAAKPQTGAPHAAGVLGFAGALPFVALAGLSFYDNVNVSLQSIEILRLYGALVLSFLGGVHWGLALVTPATSGTASWRRYGVSVVPASRVGPHLLMSAYSQKRTWRIACVGGELAGKNDQDDDLAAKSGRKVTTTINPQRSRRCLRDLCGVV